MITKPKFRSVYERTFETTCRVMDALLNAPVVNGKALVCVRRLDEGHVLTFHDTADTREVLAGFGFKA